ncbi:hypothetical protein RI129_008910 [Pyrocoelia pectoralis]|uniref:Uncharacterized protein n=1 Tax=Pyrocoelia pectoralis TaxID=417401 RepID=A0AAN7ZKJ2_9COLE
MEQSANTIKKSVKRKPPVIRQTLTSMYRMAKANPLLFIEDATVNKIPVSNADFATAKLPINLKSVTMKPSVNNNNTKIGMKPNISNKSNKVTVATSKPSLTQAKRRVITQNKLPNGDIPPNKKEGQKVRFVDKMKRRSRSADSYDPRFVGSFKQISTVSSLTDVHKNDLNNISPIVQERKVKFQTPIKSTNTPFRTPFNKRHSTPYTTGDHHLQELQGRLKEWLRKHKISSEKFKHLKCFDLHKANMKEDDENKENVEVGMVHTSYDDLRIQTPVAVHTKPEDLRSVVQGCLDDLHKLILEGYSVEQSEAWLNVIRDKYCYLDNEPQYWECRAALEQNRNNLTSAVECLRNAIVQGAAIKSIDHSLEQLLQKFCLLNINTPKDNNAQNERARIVKDARSVFKSSIIQFAIQERTMKKNIMNTENEKKFKATPVRRSTRLTPSRYRFTPKVQICSSLHELDDSVRSNIDFQGNTELNVRFSTIEKAD